MSIFGVGNSNGSSGDEINTRKRTREESRSVVVEKLLRKYKVDKLTVEFDPLTGKGVGKVGSAFNNMIVQLVRDTFSPRITRWKDQISAQNSHNRMQRPLEGGHGSKSIVAHVYDKVDLDTGKLPNVIDTFEQLHRKAHNGWRNE